MTAKGDRSMRTPFSPPALVVLGLAAALLPATVEAPLARATGSYPGETLMLAAAGPTVAGQAANLVASGQQTDVDSYAGGFGLDVFAKDPAVDATCASSYLGEENTYLTEMS